MEYSVSTLKTNTIQAATGSVVSIPGHILQVKQAQFLGNYNFNDASY